MATNNITIKNADEFDNHVLFTYINQWEKHSIGKIQLAAQEARNDLKELFAQQRQDFVHLLSQINKEIDADLNTNSNLIKWTEQLNKLRRDLSTMSAYIHLEHEKSKAPLYLIKLFQKNTKQMDKDQDDDCINIPGTKPLTPSMLKDITLSEQKQMLGERLFVLVQQIEPNFAAKITGMFLEFDIKYIIILIKSNQTLKVKIKEALDVLQAFRYRQRHVTKT